MRTVRFGVSIEEDLIKRFDRLILLKSYKNRSEAIRDLIRKNLIEKEWEKDSKIIGCITILYNHHKRELVNRLLDLQHDFNRIIVSTQHIHVDHDNCLEIIVVKGASKEAEKLYDKLRALCGVKHCALAKTTTGKDL